MDDLSCRNIRAKLFDKTSGSDVLQRNIIYMVRLTGINSTLRSMAASVAAIVTYSTNFVR